MKNTNKPEKTNTQPINEQIRVPRLQVISHDGINLGTISRDDALRKAYIVGLDLVLIADQGAEGVPVAKIMDFGKAIYAKKKKQSEAKKHQKIIQVKEIKIRPKIGEHDFLTKMNQALEFLKEGKHVKVTLQFRGREIVTADERGTQLFEKINSFFEQAEVTNLAHEKDGRMGQLWSRIFFLKSNK